MLSGIPGCDPSFAHVPGARSPTSESLRMSFAGHDSGGAEAVPPQGRRRLGDTVATKRRPGLRMGRGLTAGALDAPAEGCREEYHLGSFCCQRRSINPGSMVQHGCKEEVTG